MDKELIINMLEDTDIKYVIGIDINLILYCLLLLFYIIH